MAAWDDEGTIWDSAGPKVHEWFPVDTTTGQWGTPTPTIGATTGMMPSMTETPAPALGPASGQPDLTTMARDRASVAPFTSPAMAVPRAMPRVQRLDEMGALTPKPSVWESIARGVAMASPMGKAYLGYADSRAQQERQNQLVMRRQALQEEQNARAEIRDDFNTLVQLSNVKSKALRNLYTDRWVASMQEKGKSLPADFIETFKKAGIDEGKQMAELLAGMATKSGMDPALVVQALQEGRDPKEIMQLMELHQKQTKLDQDQERLRRLDAVDTPTLGDVSGVTAPATPGAPTTATTAPGTRQPIAAPSKDISDAIDESTRLYPQVRKELITSMAASESNFDSQAKSSAGAEGVMQLMPGTAKDMGVTDPYDVKQNVRGGTRYFAQMLTRYKGNEALALAAYNWGPGHVDKVEGDLSKMPAETQAYVKTTLQRASGGGGTTPDTRMMVAGPGAPASTQTATGVTPQEQQALAGMDQQIARMKAQIGQFERIGGEEGNKRADNARANLNILVQERNRLETRLLEPTRAAERLEASKQTGAAAAERQLEAKMNEPIGNEAAKDLDLPSATKWKDVPKDLRPKKDPSSTERDAMTHLRASVAGVDRLMQALDKPEVAKMVGTLFTASEAAVNRILGNWLSTLPPEQRAFAATMAGEIMEIRHRLIGAGQTGIEVNALAPMMPSPADTDVATVRAKLTALREGMLRRHDAKREDLEGMGFRVPAKLTQPAEKPPLDPKAQEVLDILKPKGKGP